MQLLIGDLRRAVKDKALWLALFVLLGIVVLMALLFIMTESMIPEMLESGAFDDMIASGELDPMALEFFKDPEMVKMAFGQAILITPLGCLFLVLISAIGISVFNGGDFTFNTIRNKIIAGNSRTKIYLAQLCVNLVLFFIFFFATFCISLLLGTVFFTITYFIQILKQLLLALPLYLSAVSIMTFVCQSTKSRSLGIVINVLLVVLLPSLLSILSGLFVGPVGIISEILEANPYTMLDTVALSNYTVALEPMNILKMMLVAVAYAAVSTTAGILLFKRTDIK